MKVCSHCKTQNNDSANYCRQCGFVFPDVNLQSGNIDNSLVDKVNELQKRVSDAEANSINSQREINTLNSRVSSLVSTNSTLQNKLTQTERQLSSANNTISSERQKAQNAQKEVDNARKSLEDAESSKSTLHILYIIIIVILGITAFVQCNGNQSKESEIYSLQNKKSELEGQVKTLKSENSNLSNTNKSLSSVLEKVGSKTPLFLGDVSIRNSGESYGSTIYSSRTTYINPKVEIFSLTDGRVDINVKLYTPYGLSTGTSSSGGYSYSNYFYVSKNQTTTCEFNGWGGKDKGHWSSGNYRFEFYYKGKCIGSKSFTIY
ncbi:MAG: hypothetical protein K6E73_00110 [Bacteroidales bacterium]|nr:hypothetical protein [Bacteroidales bacterium]